MTESDDETTKAEPVVEKKKDETPKKDELEAPTKEPEIEQLKSDNKRLRELMTTLQLKQQTTSLEVNFKSRQVLYLLEINTPTFRTGSY